MGGNWPPCTPWMRAVSLRVFVLAELDVQAPLKYLELKQRAASEDDVRMWYAALSEEERAVLLDPPEGDATAVRQLAEARRFIEERGLVSWVYEQNTAKGLAPTSGAILQHLGPSPVGGHLVENRCRRIRRCMRRWGGRRARLKPGASLTPEEFHNKVHVLSESKAVAGHLKCGDQFDFGVHLAGMVLGPYYGPCFGPACHSFNTAGPKQGPCSGPCFGPANRSPSEVLGGQVATLTVGRCSRPGGG